MSLTKIVQRVFAERDGVIDKPSFQWHEVFFIENDFALAIQPLYQKKTITRVPKSIGGVYGAITGDFGVLASVEGYFVGGMNKAICTCGREPIFVYSNEKSKEPGRENQLLFDELGLSRNARLYQSKNIPLISNGQYNIYLAGLPLNIQFSLEEYPFFKNRRYELWILAGPEKARAYRDAFERMREIKPEARFETFNMGNQVFCMLSAPYVMLRPEQERKTAQTLISLFQ